MLAAAATLTPVIVIVVPDNVAVTPAGGIGLSSETAGFAARAAVGAGARLPESLRRLITSAVSVGTKVLQEIVTVLISPTVRVTAETSAQVGPCGFDPTGVTAVEIALEEMDFAWAVVGKVSIIKVETNAIADIKVMMTRGRKDITLQILNF